MHETILIIDYGSQYTQLIARRLRELNVFCIVYPYHKISIRLIDQLKPSGVILSGGPNSVLDRDAPKLNNFILKLSIPILGICYGLQLICSHLGGKIHKSKSREYGYALISIFKKSSLLTGLKKNNNQVWMSHGDHVVKIPNEFEITSKSNNNLISSIENKKIKYLVCSFILKFFTPNKEKKFCTIFSSKYARLQKNL